MQIKKIPKLSLKRETITKLSNDQMRKVVGGANLPVGCSCNNSSCNSKCQGSCSNASCNCTDNTN